VPVLGEHAEYPVYRIFCVGRNYAAHAAEMGAEVDRESPFYFTKPSMAVVLSGASVPYAVGTSNLHYELELVVAIGRPVFRADVVDAKKAVFGYAAGLDMTRRDLQLAAKEKGRPWDLGKAYEQSAVVSRITRAGDFPEIGPQRISLEVNAVIKQDAVLSDLIWSVPEIVSHLSGFYHLAAGDLIYTGTPAGVGPVVPGDEIFGQIDGLDPVRLTIVDGE
jgi:fumarylpyruvate hydrolase